MLTPTPAATEGHDAGTRHRQAEIYAPSCQPGLTYARRRLADRPFHSSPRRSPGRLCGERLPSWRCASGDGRWIVPERRPSDHRQDGVAAEAKRQPEAVSCGRLFMPGGQPGRDSPDQSSGSIVSCELASTSGLRRPRILAQTGLTRSLCRWPPRSESRSALPAPG